MAPRILANSTAVALLALPSVTPASSEDDLSQHPIIDGEFEIQPYELPDGWRHLTSMINEAECWRRPAYSRSTGSSSSPNGLSSHPRYRP
jgi:hypothetical protein